MKLRIGNLHDRNTGSEKNKKKKTWNKNDLEIYSQLFSPFIYTTYIYSDPTQCYMWVYKTNSTKLSVGSRMVRVCTFLLVYFPRRRQRERPPLFFTNPQPPAQPDTLPGAERVAGKAVPCVLLPSADSH